MYAGLVSMRETCPRCGLVYEREHGYFTGAMAVSYGLAVPALALVTLLVGLASRWPLEWTLLGGDVLFLPLVPAIFRYSRVLWMHFDRLVDPDR